MNSLFESITDGLIGLSNSAGSWLSQFNIDDLSRVLNGAMLAANTASSISRYRDGRRRADELRSSIEQSTEANVGTLREQQAQREAQAKEQLSERARQAMLERARLRAISASAGLSGPGLDDYEQVSQLSFGQDRGTIESNIASTQRQTGRAIDAAYARANDQRNRIVEPNLFSTGLELIGGLANYARNVPRDKKPQTQRNTYG